MLSHNHSNFQIFFFILELIVTTIIVRSDIKNVFYLPYILAWKLCDY